MSNVNIRRAVENIRANTTVYTPLVEVIVNAIQAIDANPNGVRKIKIQAIRDPQPDMYGDVLPDIHSFSVEDSGIGFTDDHRESFDTLYTDMKASQGGKGFGRFTCLKYFEGMEVESRFLDGKQMKVRRFSMGTQNDIIVDETVEDSEDLATGSKILLRTLKASRSFEKKLSTIGRNLVEKLLPYFVTEDYSCPEITLFEDGALPIVLNDYLKNDLAADIKEIATSASTFTLNPDAPEAFKVRVFKFYHPRSQKSKICLAANHRDVAGSVLSKYIPEFEDEFFEHGESDGSGRNYIIKAYVFGNYLDRHVSLERGGFEFQIERDLVYGISQTEIEAEAAAAAKAALGGEISTRQDRKREQVQSYVDGSAPWHKEMLETVDITSLPLNPSEDQIEEHLQRAKFSRERKIKATVSSILAKSGLDHLEDDVKAVVESISATSKNDLVHYVALRRNLLDLFEKSLQRRTDGKYESEGFVHDIIFPRKQDSDGIPFASHQLWLIDERLNFTSYMSSDKPLNGHPSDRPDLLAFGNRIAFRGDNEASNPITVFEFKRPNRDDFTNPSSNEDPIAQIVRYVNSIRSGEYLTPVGRKIMVLPNTPFYGYVVCSLSTKVEKWLEEEKNFKSMPDRLGWFYWFEKINLYIEVLSWDKVLRDAQMRNRVFFKMLGI
ncbi:ATP-binding protein [Tahibacter caeni]|uniref:ATP-binding protein n=1 Tax=Tahibacter caeni TaxID=1453545 RepID=UPI002148923A|nr:ATP-binding protein [Tahibacter caeni]